MPKDMEAWYDLIAQKLGHKDFAVIYKLMAAKFGVWDMQDDSFQGVVAWLDMTFQQGLEKWYQEWVVEDC